MRGWLLLWIAGCGGSTVVPTPEDTDVTDTDTVDSDTVSDSDDTEPQGTDADGDGWTVEAGDCNDGDIWVNPAWDEVADDNKDNNCDGRIDEKLHGVTVLDVSTDGAAARLHAIDSFGEVESTKALTTPLSAYSMIEASDGDGWVMTEPGLPGVVQIHNDGEVSLLWDDSETEYPEDDAPFLYGGIGRLPDGSYVVDGGNRLWIVDSVGATEVARWDCLRMEGEEIFSDICPYDVAVDSVTGEVGLFGAFGGFATWSAEAGLEILAVDDPEVAPYQFIAAEKRVGGPYLALGMDMNTGEWGVYRWDAANAAVALKGAWPNSSFTPSDIVVEQGSGDIYVSANGGWHYTVWRMVADGSYTGMLYDSGEVEPKRSFRALGLTYD